MANSSHQKITAHSTHHQLYLILLNAAYNSCGRKQQKFQQQQQQTKSGANFFLTVSSVSVLFFAKFLDQ
ncbi:unnamed protein product [Ceratitis capitata]|uniref:(Mediterranean fruit fly) hypothetical protein n=1 Tax=Ceratitis capitata TaxID=7213 RepID=A0A811UCI3_CERCA|nr:unnamed protein product [Ceratitis capitata]